MGSVLITACGLPCLLEKKKKEKIHLERIGDVWVTVVGGVGVVCVCHF